MFRWAERSESVRGRAIAVTVVASLVLSACGDSGGDADAGPSDTAATTGDTSQSTPSTATTAGATGSSVPEATTVTTDAVRRDWTNEAVRVWQQFLKDGGATIDVDGFFGPQSEAATKAFQATMGIPETGVADPVTLAAAGVRVRDAVQAEMTILTTTTTTERVPQPDDPVVTISCPATETETQTRYRATFSHTESYVAFASISIDYGDGHDFSSRIESSGLDGAFWHVYETPGTFDVEVVITDRDGREATASCTHTWSPG